MKGLGIPSLGGLVDVYDAIVAPFTPGSPASRDPKSGKAVPPSSSKQIGTPGSVNMDSERARRRAGINPSALSPGEIDAIKRSRVIGQPRSLGADLAALEFAPNTERDYANQASLTAADFAAAINAASNAAYEEHGGSFPGGKTGSSDGNGGGNGGGGGGSPSGRNNIWSNLLASRTDRIDADLIAALTRLAELEQRRRTRQGEDANALNQMITGRNQAATGTNFDFSQDLRGQGIDPADFLQGPNQEILGLLADSGNAANRFTNRMFGIDDWASTDREMALRSNAVENLRELEDTVMFGERAEEQAAAAARAQAAAKSLAHQRSLEKIMLAAEQDRMSDAYSSQMDQVMAQIANEAFARNMGIENFGDFGSMTSNMWDDYLSYSMVTPKDQYDIDLKNERLDLDTRKWLSGMGLESQIGQMKEAGIDIADLVDYMVARGITVDPSLGAAGFLSDARG